MPIPRETHYMPNQRAQMGWISSLVTILRDCIASRELILLLFKRDYLMLYKKSFLGMGWHIAAPIMGILSWVMMDSTGVLDPGDVGMPYPAYILISTSIWGLFMASFANMSQVLEVASGFIHQVGFPRHALIVKQWLETAAGFLVTMIVMIVGAILCGVYPPPLALLFPLALLPIVLLGSAIGLMVSVIKVVSPDVQKAVTFAMGFWMYITPVIYSPRVNNVFLQKAIEWNPMAHLLVGARSLFATGQMDDPFMFLAVSVGAMCGFMVSLRLFFVTEQKVIERLL